MQIGDAGEQACVERNFAAVDSQFRGVVTLHLLQTIIPEACHQIAEHIAHVGQQAAGAFQCLNRVGEIRGCRVGGNTINIGQRLGHTAIKRCREMFGADMVERRRAERGGPDLKEGIFVHPAEVPRRHPSVKVPISKVWGEDPSANSSRHRARRRLILFSSPNC